MHYICTNEAVTADVIQAVVSITEKKPSPEETVGAKLLFIVCVQTPQ